MKLFLLTLSECSSKVSFFCWWNTVLASVVSFDEWMHKKIEDFGHLQAFRVHLRVIWSILAEVYEYVKTIATSTATENKCLDMGLAGVVLFVLPSSFPSNHHFIKRHILEWIKNSLVFLNKLINKHFNFIYSIFSSAE